jgi:hypothetical protein
VVALLLSTPSMIFAQSVAIVDTELRDQGADPTRVLTRLDLGDEAQLQRIPRELGPWRLAQERDWDRVAEILNTDVLLSRDYTRSDLLQPANLLIVQSTNVSSFHPAPVCYRAQGWTVPADGGRVVTVHVPNATWAQERWLSDAETNVFGGNITAKLLEATKTNAAGEVVEKRVALYVYLKKEDWRVTKEVTWIRTEIVIPPDSPAEEALPVLSSLLGETVPQIFTFRGEETTFGEELWRRIAGPA